MFQKPGDCVAVEFERIGREFDGVFALRGISGRFDRGRAHVIVGPNGSGKTTLLRIIATLLNPTSGSVTYEFSSRTPAAPIVGSEADSEPLPTIKVVEREVVRSAGVVGYCGLDSNMYSDLTGRENLRLYAGIYGLGDADIEKTVVRLAQHSSSGEGGSRGAWRWLDRSVKSISRGQRQQLALARSLLHSPTLLLLDEPSACLDNNAVNTLVRVLHQEASLGHVLIVATHDAQTFDRIPNRLWRMERGRWVGR